MKRDNDDRRSFLVGKTAALHCVRLFIILVLGGNIHFFPLAQPECRRRSTLTITKPDTLLYSTIIFRRIRECMQNYTLNKQKFTKPFKYAKRDSYIDLFI